MRSLQTLYLLTTGILLLRLLAGVVLSLRLLSRAVPARFDGAASSHVRISRDVAAPVTVANVILLPVDAVDWPVAIRQAVIAHEHAHAARWDYAMLLASHVNRAIFWFTPLPWWLHRRLAGLAELASDDQALAVMGDRAAYAEVLLDMGRRSGPMLRGLGMARLATLPYRIDRILSGRAQPAPVSPMQQVILAVGAAGLSIVAASSTPSPSPAPVESLAAEQEQPSAFLQLPPSPSALAPSDVPAQTPALPPKNLLAFQPPPQPAVAQPAANAIARPVVRAAMRPVPRPKARTALLVLAPRLMRQPAGTVNSRPTPGTPLEAEQDITAAAAPPFSKRIEELSCAGVYVPRPGAPPADRSLDLIQARYFREADGTPWVKFFVGERTRATLTGREVERTSVRTTVVTILPKDTDHPTGTTRGPYGSIDFECRGGNAHL
jgi:hypothetical protein